ncbi:MAG: hypothetical protein M1821_005655 [Bathelium mastoideum]|nr:MAG: hypothetical protein M1821_005655 [Bathelium mastoideum]
MAQNGKICGCYYMTSPTPPVGRYAVPVYLPQAELKSYTTIVSTSSRTILTQTFHNPSTTHGIQELYHTFPLYQGVSVVGFRCVIGSRVINGVVKEREKARADFNEAVDQGKQAGLLEQLPAASDVFTTTLGNILPAAKIIVEITYVGELKNDVELDGIRFTIPTKIAPRYGDYPGQLACSNFEAFQASKGMEIVVDVQMPEGSLIKAIQSPSHRLSVSIGTTSSAPDAEPKLNQASASLRLLLPELKSDFILQILNTDTSNPKAILETHPSIPNQRALMVSLVPKFSLPQARPEIVFIADRSGSMRDKIPTLISALDIFLKSLPVGVMFNICSFGNQCSFLWEKSKAYGQATLDEALIHTQDFKANFGGTEMHQPIKATIANRYGDLPLEMIFLTDGQIWQQQAFFDLLNQSIRASQAPIRIFSLGIGSAISHSLIEGIARAGNGFSQTVGQDEKLDRKVVRMLKGALTPHIVDCSLEVRYGDEDDHGDFELVDKVEECLNLGISVGKSETVEEDNQMKQPISLFDANADPDKDDYHGSNEDGQERYKHLPALPLPKILQVPARIPSLFPFIRTSVYLLFSPEATIKKPTSVTLRGISKHGPLQLEIPVHILDNAGETIHQLAAKKAVQELEEGRGWIVSAKDQTDGALLKDKLPSQFSQMVEREAVRLGVQFQVGGKWCSFVAVEAGDEEAGEDSDKVTTDCSTYEFLDTKTKTGSRSGPRRSKEQVNPSQAARGFACKAKRTAKAQPPTNAMFCSLPRLESRTTPTAASASSGDSSRFRASVSRLEKAESRQLQPTADRSTLEILISLQTFDGSWAWKSELFKVLNIDELPAMHFFQDSSEDVDRTGYSSCSTALVVCFCKLKLGDEQETWELVVDKAVSWLVQAVSEELRGTIMSAAEKLVQDTHV